MLRNIAIVLFLLLAPACVAAQSLDTYGGRTDISCTNATGHFTIVQIGSRFWFCTPAGHAYFKQGVAAAISAPLSKYGGTQCSANNQKIAEWKGWGFNSIGELPGDPNYFAAGGGCPSVTQLPFVQTFLTANYVTAQSFIAGYPFNQASSPTKNLRWGASSPNLTHSYGVGSVDVFDPVYTTALNGMMANSSLLASWAASPYFVGIFTDDTDFLAGFGGTPAFDTVLPGHLKTNLGYLVLVASPVQTFAGCCSNGATYNSTPVYFTDTKVYAKTAMTSPPTTCNLTTPCSLRTYLAKKYGTIGALNTAWGTTYTTFDSTGTQVTAETCDTYSVGKKVFTCTLAHNPVSPFSVAVKVGSTIEGGDCPWFNVCDMGDTNKGTLQAAGASTILESGIQMWAQPQQLSSANAPGSGLPPAVYSMRMVPHNSTHPGIPSRCCVVTATFNTGEPQLTVISQNNAGDLPPGATGVDIYVSCRVLSGGATHGCAAAASSFPAETLQATNVAYPGGSFTEATTGLVAGAALPTAPSFINYTLGTATVTFVSDPGSAPTLDYIYGGWGAGGTGLMDEDGTRQASLGTNDLCLAARVGSIGGTNFMCDGVNYPVVNANSTLGADIEGWTPQWSAQYFKTSRTAVKTSYPNLLYGGTDTIGDWSTPPRIEILQGAVPYSDFLFTNELVNQPSSGEGLARLDYFTTGYTGPIVNFMTLHAQPDSALAANGNSACCFGLSTQTARGTQWYNIINTMLNRLSTNGTYQWVGIEWWGSADNSVNEGIDWGLSTSTDNAYDAHEPASGVVTCSAPLAAFNCGSEPAPGGGATRPFSDMFGGGTGVTAANALWLAVPAPGAPTGCVIGSGAVIGSGSIICDDLTVKYSTPNPLTFTFSTPNTLNLSVAATQPIVTNIIPYPLNGGTCITPKSSRKSQQFTCLPVLVSSTQTQCNCH